MVISIDEDMTPHIDYVVFRKCTPAWEMTEQKFNRCDLTYVVHGNALYRINKVEYEEYPL